MILEFFGGVADVLLPGALAFIETEALPAYLMRRRWFASKDQAIQSVRLARAELLSLSTGEVLLSEINVQLPGKLERYQLPLGLAWDGETDTELARQLALARVRRSGRTGYLTDAFALDLLPLGLIGALRENKRAVLPNSEIRCLSTVYLNHVTIRPATEIRRFSAEQSNSSLILGNALVMKLIRRVMSGINPEVEMVRHLTERGYANTPPLLGEISRAADGEVQSMIVVQRFAPNQGDAWGYTLDYLKKPANELQNYAVLARAIGTRLGELHAALAKPSDDPAFDPVPAGPAACRAWAQGAAAQLATAFETLQSLQGAPETVASPAGFVLEHRDKILAALPALAAQGEGSMQTRVHGDFHLGQILVTENDAYIIDFEGEPAKPLEVRRAKSSPMRDVAGLLRSFHYAAAAAQSPHAHFVTQMSAEFLASYNAVESAAQPRWGGGAAAEDALLNLFLLEKSAYEICYEAANRPGWLAIPLRGFAEIAARVLHLTPEHRDE